MLPFQNWEGVLRIIEWEQAAKEIIGAIEESMRVVKQWCETASPEEKLGALLAVVSGEYS